MRNTILFSSLIFLILFGVACMRNPSDLPDPEGYDGFLELGWQAVSQGEHLNAYDYFQQAIAVDLSRAEGFLGAGVACLYLEDYWSQGDAFFQSAIQKDCGSSLVVQYQDEAQIQDTMWTVFQCIDPDLPQDSLDIWLSLTTDSGEVWVGEQIYNYLFVNQLSTDLQFSFSPSNSNAVACADLFNVQSGAFYSGDSTVSGSVYLTVPLLILDIEQGADYYTWVMVNQNIIYDYASFNVPDQEGQITLDALAARVMLQEIRGDTGDLLQAVASAAGLLQIAPDFKFGYGSPLRESVFGTDIVDASASAASYVFLNKKYIISWFICKQVGYGLSLDPQSENFLLDLLELFAQMGR
ncbi:MAG: hypothetical protein K8S62_01790 [Candidatus Sabulitectum sp.]|nr:hypothetical protein [Candidatus Sabulitectum sp.]